MADSVHQVAQINKDKLKIDCYQIGINMWIGNVKLLDENSNIFKARLVRSSYLKQYFKSSHEKIQMCTQFTI